MPKLSFKQKIGAHIEKSARQYLEKQGLLFMACNYKTRYGEIDLIMKDKEVLVFIEVRYRKSDQFGGAIESIDEKKQQRISRTAQSYLLTFKITDKFFCRFDVIVVSGNLLLPDIHWIKQAFDS